MSFTTMNSLNFLCGIIFLTMGVVIFASTRKGRFLWLLGGFGLLFGLSFLLEESGFLLVHPALKGFVPFFESLIFPARLGALFLLFQFGVELLHGRAGLPSFIRFIPALLFLPWLIAGLTIPEFSAWSFLSLPYIGAVRVDYLAGMLGALIAGYAIMSGETTRPAHLAGLTLLGLAVFFGFGAALTKLSQLVFLAVENHAELVPWLQSGGKEIPGILFLVGLSFFAGAVAIALLRSKTFFKAKIESSGEKSAQDAGTRSVSPGSFLAYEKVLGGISKEYARLLGPMNQTLEKIRKLKEGGDYDHSIYNLKQLIDRAEAITEELGSFSRADIDYNQSVKINSVIRNVVKEFLSSLTRTGIAVFVQPGPIQKIHLNPGLVENAVRALLEVGASRVGNRKGEISLETREEEKEIVISVKYNFPLIDINSVEQLFIPYRLGFQSGRHPGKNYSLAPVYTLINSIGGRLEFEQETETDFSIIIRLPVYEVPDIVYQEYAPVKNNVRVQAFLNGFNILILENNKPLRDIIIRTVTDKGGKVDYATHSRAAVQMLEEKKYNLFFLDIITTDTNAEKLMKELRAKAGNIPIIIVLRKNEKEFVEPLKMENIYFIRKDFDPESLQEKMREALHIADENERLENGGSITEKDIAFGAQGT
ncbi:MAG: response regulator [Chloroflexi bacterium]|nr:response regulator [Chloroflexota bacterium]